MASISLKYKSKNGNLTAPGDVDPGAMIPIATVTVGSGGASDITFSNIPNTYEHLQIRGIHRTSATVNTPTARVQFNSDTAANYSTHYLGGDGAAASAGSVSGASGSYMWSDFIPGASITSGVFGTLIMDILDYTNTSKYKTIRTLNGVDTNSSAGVVALISGNWRSTDAVNSIKLYYQSGDLAQYSSFALYGIKRAGA